MRCISMLIVALIAAPAFAQTGPSLLAKPFADGARVEGHAQGTFLDDFNTGPGTEFGLNIYDAEGRVQITGEDQHNIRAGFSLTVIDIDGTLTLFGFTPDQLVDNSFEIAATIGKWRDWQIDAAAGIGFAGDDPYSDRQALYAMADLLFTKEVDDATSWQIFINYDGNRSFLPDVPLPGIAYNHKVSDTFWYTAGVPMSSITWLPADRWRIDLEYIVPVTANITIDFEPIDTWHIFGAFENRLDSFALDGDVSNRRVFFEQRRLEGGVRWVACENFEIEVAGGYAFDQSFDRGFDIRTTTDLLGPGVDDNAAYVRVGVDITF